MKRSNTTDCKSVGIRLRRFESYPQYHSKKPSSYDARLFTFGEYLAHTTANKNSPFYNREKVSWREKQLALARFDFVAAEAFFGFNVKCVNASDRVVLAETDFFGGVLYVLGSVVTTVTRKFAYKTN